MLLLVDAAALPGASPVSCEFIRVDFSVDGNCAVEQFFQTVGVLAAQGVGIAVCSMGIPCKKATKDFFLCYLTRRVCLFPMPDFGFHPFGAVPTQLLDDRAGFSQIRMEPQKINAVPQWEDAGYTDVERGERGSTEEHLTVTQFKVQREQERLDTLTAQADQKAQSLAKTSQTLSKKEKELAAVQKKATLTKEALIHARDLDYIGKRTFLGNYSLTEEEFSKLKKQADHGYMMDVENRRLKEELSTAKKEAIHWSNKYHDLWYDVKPYLDALHRAPELVRGFLEKILAPKQERTMNVPQRNRKRGQDMEL